MVCVYCGSPTAVVNSRLQRRANTTWRRRKCDSCGAVISTVETPDFATAIMVINPKGKHTPFSRDKLMLSLYGSLGHRQEALSDAGELASTVISRLLPKVEGAALETKQITEVASEVLNRFDKAAGVHYQAYHKS